MKSFDKLPMWASQSVLLLTMRSVQSLRRQ